MRTKSMRLNVPQLLTALIGLGTFSLAVLTWEAERMVSAIDDLRAGQASDHSQLQVTSDRVESFGPRIDGLEVKYVDLDHRVIKLEPR
jgi:predicted PilT family ATPase